MNTSIEHIWKEGIHLQPENAAPRIADLYAKRSQQVVAKLERRLRFEVKALLPFTLAIPLMNWAFGNDLWSSVPAMAWCLVWYFIARKQTDKMLTVDATANCQQYLKSFRQKLRDGFKFYEKILWTGLPLFMFPLILYTYYNNQDKNLGAILGNGWEASNLWIFLFIPLFTVFGIWVTRMSFKLTYGRLMKRLDELIQDLETLTA